MQDFRSTLDRGAAQSTSIFPEADLDCGPPVGSPLAPSPCWAVGPLGAWLLSVSSNNSSSWGLGLLMAW